MNEKYIAEYKDKLNQNVLKNIIFNRLPILKDFGIKFIEKDKSSLLLNEIYKKIDFNSQDNKNVLLIEKNEKINLYYNEVMEFRNKIFKIQNNIECVLFIEFKEFYPVIINGNMVLQYIDIFFDITGFKEGNADFIFVSKDLSYGICIEKYEYYNKLVKWGNMSKN